jgi:hypothetical protein
MDGRKANSSSKIIEHDEVLLIAETIIIGQYNIIF